MARNARDEFDLDRAFGRNHLTLEQSGLRQAKPRRKPRNQPMLSPEEVHSDHDGNIIPDDNAAQGANIDPDPLNIDSSDAPVMHDLGMALSDQIRRARQRSGYTQNQLAKLLNVQQSAISQWESGKSEPEDKHRINLALALNVDLHVFINRMPPSLPPEILADPGVRTLVQSYWKLGESKRKIVLAGVLFLLADDHSAD